MSPQSTNAPGSAPPARMTTRSQSVRRSSDDRRVAGARSNGRGRRSRNSSPLPPVPFGAVASQINVSIPSAGVRSSGPITPEKPGSDASSPGVSAHPGCIASKAMPDDEQPTRPLPDEGHLGTFRPGVRLRARELAPRHTGGRRDRGVARTGRRRSPRSTRGSSDRRRSGSRPEISTNGPTTSVASVRSMPLGVTARSGKIAPALSMTMSSGGSRLEDALDRRAHRRERAHVRRDDDGPVLAVDAPTSSSRNASSLSSAAAHEHEARPELREPLRGRPTEARRRPGDEDRPAAQRPGGGGRQPNSRRRTAWPTLVKLPTTVSPARNRPKARVDPSHPRCARRTISGSPIAPIRQTVPSRTEEITP